MKIYLADLVYDTVKTNFVVPLNIAYLAAHLDQTLGRRVEIRLFKYPRELERAIETSPPDLLALSHYSWNTRLGALFLELARKRNPGVITVMGGPHIRLDGEGVADFLRKTPLLDYYVMLEGEEPFAALVAALLAGNGDGSPPAGCAALREGALHYQPTDSTQKPREITFPSPYLNGWLDPFLKDPEMIPIFESNRGCPYACVYCAWGVSALSKVRLRPLDLFVEELEHVARLGAGRHLWMVADANFGILERDLEIAEEIRRVRAKYGYAGRVATWAAKNTTDRNLTISDILSDESRSSNISIQSADPKVLNSSGRGKIKFSRLREQIQGFSDRGHELHTDLLVGLPDETAQSHLESLATAFDLGFRRIDPINIRLLPGTDYESPAFRDKYGVLTRFRSIFGAYGTYGGRSVFELEESIRATRHMSEADLDQFKVAHWLIWFGWNVGLFKPQLDFGLRHGVNPARILWEVSHTEQPPLAGLFADMRAASRAEWFDSAEEMIRHYEDPGRFESLAGDFVKLNFAFIAQVYQSPETAQALENAINARLRTELAGKPDVDREAFERVCLLASQLVCKDPLEEPSQRQETIPAALASYFLRQSGLQPKTADDRDEILPVTIARTPATADFCRRYLAPHGQPDLSLINFTRFLEIGGLDKLRYELTAAAPAPSQAKARR